MTTSCNFKSSFSNSYSMLTSHAPSFEGVGQQLTVHELLEVLRLTSKNNRT